MSEIQLPLPLNRPLRPIPLRKPVTEAKVEENKTGLHRCHCRDGQANQCYWNVKTSSGLVPSWDYMSRKLRGVTFDRAKPLTDEEVLGFEVCYQCARRYAQRILSRLYPTSKSLARMHTLQGKVRDQQELQAFKERRRQEAIVAVNANTPTKVQEPVVKKPEEKEAHVIHRAASSNFNSPFSGLRDLLAKPVPEPTTAVPPEPVKVKTEDKPVAVPVKKAVTKKPTTKKAVTKGRKKQQVRKAVKKVTTKGRRRPKGKAKKIKGPRKVAKKPTTKKAKS